jgi:WD40 repeat protein
VAFSPDGTTLAAGSRNSTIYLWDVASGRQGKALVGHRSAVRSVAFSPDGTTLASGSNDRTIAFWDVRGGERLASLTGHSDAVRSVAFSPDGTTLASGSDDETVIPWDGTVNIVSWQRQACRLANRNLTHLEWQQYVGSALRYQLTCPQQPQVEQQTAPVAAPGSAAGKPTTTATNPRTTTGTTLSAAFPDPSERQLLAHVPRGRRANCARAPQRLVGAIAAIRCSDNNQISVQYNLFRSTTVMNRSFSSRIKTAGAHVGLCRQTGTQPHVDRVIRVGRQVGRILCYRGHGQARLEWTHEPLRIYASTFSTRLTTHSLYHQVFERAGPLS